MDIARELNDRLLFAVPKKGRLHEPCMQLLKGADVQFHRKNRLDIALCTNLPVAIVFLPAADIGKFVGEGNVDLGITGLDVIAEEAMESKCVEKLALGFGKCRLSIQAALLIMRQIISMQAPDGGAIKSAKDLVGKRVVTSFERLTANFVRKLEGKSSNEPLDTKINFISGSVEAACALGLADAIVDLVESGETMRAAKLHEVATVMTSEAVLIANPRAAHPDLVATLTNRIKGVIAATRHVLVKYNLERKNLPLAIKITPGNRAPTLSPLENDGWIAVEAMIGTTNVAETLDRLEQIGAKDILVLNLANCRV